MDTEGLARALRLAVDPPGGVNVGALQDLVRDEDSADWDIATTAAHLQVSPHTLRRQIAQLQLSLAATEYKIATYSEGPRP
ncbi:MAG: hypothetical protein WAW78_03740 [Propioniciclava sp.]